MSEHPSDSSTTADDSTEPNLQTSAVSTLEKLHLSLPELGEKVAAEVGIDQTKAMKAIQIIQEESHEYSGPIPSAAELQQLNDVSPELGTRIAKDFLISRAHERVMDRKVMKLEMADSRRKDLWLTYARRGQNFGMLSQVLFIASALFAMYMHYPIVAGLFVAGPALGVIAQFIKGSSASDTNSQSEDDASE